MELRLKTTTKDDADFLRLVACLDEDFYRQFGAEVTKYAPDNRLENMLAVVLVYDGTTPVGCGAYRWFEGKTVEMKRVFVLPEYRRQCVASQVMRQLEQLAREEGYSRAVLETGQALQGAVALYHKLGYEQIENYGEYVGDAVCFCMGKALGPGEK